MLIPIVLGERDKDYELLQKVVQGETEMNEQVDVEGILEFQERES